MNTSSINLSTIRRYLQAKLKSQDVLICDINSLRKNKFVLTALISEKKYCVYLQQNHSLYYEQIIMSQLGKFSPKVVFYDQSKKCFPYEIMLVEHSGEASLMKKILQNKKIDFVSIGKAIQKLHGLPPKSCPKLKDKFKEIHKTLVTQTLTIQNRFPALSSDILRQLKSFPSIKLNMLISHNDLSSHNIILGRDVPVMIDYDSLGYNVKEYDLAYLFSHLALTPLRNNKIRLYLAGLLKKNPLEILTHKEEIFDICSNLTSYNIRPCFEIKLNKNPLNSILKGYGSDVSRDMLFYCSCLIRLKKLLIELIDSLLIKKDDFDIFETVRILMVCDVMPLAKDSTREIFDHIKKL